MQGEIDKHLAGVTFTPAVVGILTDGGRVCLGVRKSVSGGLGENLIAGIGGKVGDTPDIQNETAEQAMNREADEEIKVRITNKKYMGRVRFMFSHKSPDSKWNQDVSVYVVTGWNGTPTETESTKPEWFEVGNIPWESMWEDNKYWMLKVLAGRMVNAVFLFNGDNKISEYRFDPISS